MSALSTTYAASLFSLAEDEGLTENVMSEICEIDTLLKDNKEYQLLLNSPTVSLTQRLSLIDEAFSSAHEYVRNFLKLLCEKKCVHVFSECVKEYKKIYNQKNKLN
mgnify:CR=1 FL=1